MCIPAVSLEALGTTDTFDFSSSLITTLMFKYSVFSKLFASNIFKFIR